ncbi:GNAT family N-acetyltransferase [Candidatus Woesearchaeota archaeon]|jgi:hypothetical protein|nr:GNAT family N-acetyltransferase [Candidatus Woesearchaeota archaeon]MBT6519564.1 GNAT family N-acetyltransferase [Candidatus Woesearchaeota archaeon]MBT7367691.1 GNAT family N-acetyltransferase [Candidatus Woesearchaeota archaeon]
MKCESCSVEYGKVEVIQKPEICKSCNTELNLIEFWSNKEIIEDLDFACAQKNPIILVAENCDGIAGFTWGYDLPIEKFRFLTGKTNNANYMDEISVRGDKRIKGVGSILVKNYIKALVDKQKNELVLRTDKRNPASMALFKKLDLTPIIDDKIIGNAVYDPNYPDRIYLKRKI